MRHSLLGWLGRSSLYQLTFSNQLIPDFNKVGKSPRETIELIYRGSGASEKLIQCAESWLNGRTPLKSFGNESLVGLAKGDFTEARLCKNGGADIEHQIDLKMNEIAVSGTGHIAVIDDCNFSSGLFDG